MARRRDGPCLWRWGVPRGLERGRCGARAWCVRRDAMSWCVMLCRYAWCDRAAGAPLPGARAARRHWVSKNIKLARTLFTTHVPLGLPRDTGRGCGARERAARRRHVERSVAAGRGTRVHPASHEAHVRGCRQARGSIRQSRERVIRHAQLGPRFSPGSSPPAPQPHLTFESGGGGSNRARPDHHRPRLSPQPPAAALAGSPPSAPHPARPQGR